MPAIPSSSTGKSEEPCQERSNHEEYKGFTPLYLHMALITAEELSWGHTTSFEKKNETKSEKEASHKNEYGLLISSYYSPIKY